MVQTVVRWLRPVFARFFHTGQTRLLKTKSVKEKIVTSSNMVIKVLNVAEKNDAAKNIAQLLANGNATRREGFSKFNKIYEFKYQINGQPVDMVMTSVSGHLLGLDFEEKYRKWYSCDPLQLFNLPVYKHCREQSMTNIKRTLEREVRSAKWLILWTDCDREGENIAFEIIDVCRNANPNLQRVLRAHFSEITRISIERALGNLGQPDLKTSQAVDVRQELDLRIGAAFTRFQTLRLQKKFETLLSNQVVSYGSCQFPTLGFVVERYKAIEAFVPENFWKIKVVDGTDNTKVDFVWQRNRLFSQRAAQIFHDICKENPKAKVEKALSKPKTKWRPLPMDTVELEKLGSRKLRLSAKDTMKIAEKLYTSGYISYPRTETNIFPKELNLTPLVEIQTADQRWGAFAQRILGPQGGPRPRVGKKTDKAHPPIHPTKAAKGELQGNDARVYELITRHFLACVSEDAIGKETTVTININGEKFTAHGLTVIHRNYLEVYIYDKWSDKEIRDYHEGEEFVPSSIDLVEGSTEPPQLLTEADLIALMDKHGIGTDATHAEHIETIKQRTYIGIAENDKLIPGRLGMALCDGYDAMGFQMSKPNLRAELEADLKRVCEGTRQPDEVLREQIAKYREVFILATREVEKLDQACNRYLNS